MTSNEPALDALLHDYVVTPFVRIFRLCDGLERRRTDLLTGHASREMDQVKPYPTEIEELT